MPVSELVEESLGRGVDVGGDIEPINAAAG